MNGDLGATRVSWDICIALAWVDVKVEVGVIGDRQLTQGTGGGGLGKFMSDYEVQQHLHI